MDGKNLVYGLHAVMALFEQQRPVQQLWVQDSRDDVRLESLLVRAAQQGVVVQRVPREKLDQLTNNGRHQGVVAEAGAAQAGDEEDLKAFVKALDSPAFLLVLDGVQDPHNLG
ncbi:MAG: TrmH family RNA methyltransferase, partial [Gammaproteobacteria bacterium]